jgi:acetate CoA/acetoacetate CoA-transferase alpha subunit
MATAADYVIAEVNEIVPIGEIEPNHVNVPGVLVNAIVKVG